MIKDKAVLRKLDLIFGCLLLVVSLVVLGLSIAMPIRGMGGAMQSTFWIAPGALPVVVSSVLVVLSLVLLAGGWKAGARITRADLAAVAQTLRSRPAKYMYLVSAFLIIYVCLMLGRIPYWMATFVYLCLFMVCLRAAKLHVIIIASALTTLGIWYCFGKVAMILLP
ncbi:MAG: tripartite tricarboxylate transporter TctB family protein [Planctomycetes bacterium]|nr:tripartite tricarboxylate transporter TctB family protein [Planctomycetota bacterium]